MPQETFRGQAFNTMYDMFGGSSEDPARRAQATRRAESVMGAGRFFADFTPVVSDALAIDEVRDAYRQGNMGQAAILTGLATLGMVPLVGDAAARAARGTASPLEGAMDMSTDARMQRAAEQGYTDRLRHSSSEVFAGSPQAEEALGFGIPIQNEFKKEYGGTYFAPESALTEEIFSKGPFGGSAEYLINKGNNFNANFRSMNEGQKKELMDVIGSIVDADEVDNAFDVFTDGDFYQTYGRKAQNDLLNAFSRRGYDSVTFPDNLASGDMTSSTVVFNPSNIRSVNAAFDPAMRGSANLLATAAGGTISLSALRQLMPQEEERPIE
jgi:hypothetical protein